MKAKSAPKSRAPRAPRPAKASRKGIVIAGVLVAVAAVVAVIALWRRPETAPMLDPRMPDYSGMSGQQMLDSVRVRFETRDWLGALAWSHAINTAYPRNSKLLLNEALAWHNYARSGAAQWEGRWDARTSLDRIEFEKRAFQLLDSAYAAAAADSERANVDRWRGTQYEVLGSPADAMQAYDAAIKQAPGNVEILTRISWLQRLLIRPRDPNSVTTKDAEPLRR